MILIANPKARRHDPVAARKGGYDGDDIVADAIATTHIADKAVTAAKIADAVTYRQVMAQYVSGNITSATTVPLGFAHGAGTIVKAGFRLAECGADATDALSVQGDVAIGATSVFSTKPAIAKTATDGASSFVAGTGVTVGVLDATKVTVAENKLISATLTPTRTSPETEAAGGFIWVEIEYKVGA